MSHAAHANHAAAHVHGHGPVHADFSEGNIRIGGGLSKIFLGVGALGLLGTLGAGLAVDGPHALASLLVGTMTAMAMSLSAMFLLMVIHLTNAGWAVTIRRQLENIASMIPYVGVLVLVILGIEVANKGILYQWMDPEVVKQSVILSKKTAFLNVPFFLIRAAIYLGTWTLLANYLVRCSREQDRTGDWAWAVRARHRSTFGVLAFALTTAFAAFDWLMSLDFRFFSTMWGVYFFAGGAFSSVALLALVLGSLLRAGRLKGLVTEEHLHDLGKLMFTFTVFWAYITFSQYFLIWYANVPEETAWYVQRKQGNWLYVFQLLCMGHFAVPFLILIFRPVKRNPSSLMLVGAWMVLMQVVDLFFVVRPMTEAVGEDGVTGGPAALWIDLIAVIGVLGVYLGLLVRKIASWELVPLKDPRMHEALAHRNYV